MPAYPTPPLLTMADSSFPSTQAPDSEEAPQRRQHDHAQAPALIAARGIMLAGGAALASLALIFLIPRLGGFFARLQRAAPGLLSAPRDR